MKPTSQFSSLSVVCVALVSLMPCFPSAIAQQRSQANSQDQTDIESDEQRAIEALEAYGVRLGRGRDGSILSTQVANDAQLALVKQLSGVRSLHLRGKDITDAGMRNLEPIKGLRILTMRDTSVTDAGITELKELNNLRRLELRHRKSIGQTLPAAINQLDDLGKLHLSLTDADDDQLRLIGQIQVPLELVILDSPHVTDEGIQHVAAGCLVGLNFAGTPITDEAFAHVGKMTLLERLYVREAPISNAGLAHLEQLSALRSLRLYDTKVTADGVARLQRLLPNLRPPTVENGRQRGQR